MEELLLQVAGNHPLRGIAAAGVCYLLLALVHSGGRRPGLARGALVLAGVLGGGGLAASLAVTVLNVWQPREWDFLCFWTYGRALALGQTPYDVTLLRELAAPHGPSEEFWRETYCLYPPPCVVQFWPLGFFSLSLASLAWHVVQWSAAIWATYLLWRQWDEQRRLANLIVVAALVFGLRASISTFWFGQSNFLLLLLALAYLQARRPATAGLAIGTAALIKPLGAILALDLLVRRQWRAALWTVTPVVAATALFVALQGTAGLRQYFDRNPLTEEIAAGFYTETMNQSLLATLLRVTNTQPGSRPLSFPPFVIAAGVLTLATLYVAWRKRGEPRELAFGCIVALALLVYPASLRHYSVLLLAPLAGLWKAKQSLPGGSHLAAFAWALTYGLVWARQEFAANLAVWAMAVWALARAETMADAVGPTGTTYIEPATSNAAAAAARSQLTES